MTATTILLVKTSSLGDVVHLLPAVTEAAAARPELRLHWLVEPAFAEIPSWHPAVERVIPIPFRAWRRDWRRVLRDGRWRDFRAGLRRTPYDLVVDAQGLMKSAFLASRARGPRVGPDRASAREALAALAYDRRLPVPRGLHAVDRSRRLLASALDYALAETPPGYGLDARIAELRASGEGFGEGRGEDQPEGQPEGQAERRAETGRESHGEDTVVLLHGTTWATKHWPEAAWCDLAVRLAADGLRPLVPWGTEVERLRAERIAAAGGGEVLPRGDLATLFARLVRARGVVGVDSGLLHLTAAAGTPAVALFGPTDPARTGPWGGNVTTLAGRPSCAPCLARRCRSGEPVRVDGAGAALEPPCLGELTPARVLAALRARQARAA